MANRRPTRREVVNAVFASRRPKGMCVTHRPVAEAPPTIPTQEPENQPETDGLPDEEHQPEEVY